MWWLMVVGGWWVVGVGWWWVVIGWDGWWYVWWWLGVGGGRWWCVEVCGGGGWSWWVVLAEVQKVVNPVILDDRKYIQNQGSAENISKT